MPEITKTEEVTEVTRRYSVTNADPIKRMYGASRIIPDVVVVTFVDGEFQSLKILGPIAKKDGTAGQSHSDSTYYDWNADQIPDWAVPLTRAVHDTTEKG